MENSIEIEIFTTNSNQKILGEIIIDYLGFLLEDDIIQQITYKPPLPKDGEIWKGIAIVDFNFYIQAFNNDGTTRGSHSQEP